MSRLDAIFASLRGADRRALMPFICGGHPSIESTAAALLALERAGAAVVEVGIPFSDPIADGPVIAAAMHEALRAGVTPRAVLDAVARARDAGAALGIVAMVSVSIVHRLGARQFAADAADAGIDGVIIPDAPLDEAHALAEPIRDAGLAFTLLIAPTTPTERMRRIAEACSGFVYLLARVGITGEHAAGSSVNVEGIRARVASLRAMTALPIACGFGIATPTDVRLVVAAPDNGGAGADAAIVGSALVKRMARAAAHNLDPANEAETFLRGLATGLHSA